MTSGLNKAIEFSHWKCSTFQFNVVKSIAYEPIAMKYNYVLALCVSLKSDVALIIDLPPSNEIFLSHLVCKKADDISTTLDTEYLLFVMDCTRWPGTRSSDASAAKVRCEMTTLFLLDILLVYGISKMRTRKGMFWRREWNRCGQNATKCLYCVWCKRQETISPSLMTDCDVRERVTMRIMRKEEYEN